jgi:alpha-tubulin suppressor-like RCC1 family protein
MGSNNGAASPKKFPVISLVALMVAGALAPRSLLAAEATSGRVVAWGANVNGLTNLPADLSNVVGLAAGAVHNVALKSDGTVVAWGLDNHGETTVPSGLSNVVDIAASGFFFNAYDHNLALKSDGTVVTWGSPTNPPDIFKPSGLTNIIAIATGAGHSLALRSNGTVIAWGSNQYGQTNGPANLSDAIAIAAGGAHSLALRRDGTVIAWGLNLYGQTNVPAGLNDAMAIAAGSDYSLALRSNGLVVAWGNNAFGQTNVPADATNVIAIAASGNEHGYHALALKRDGKVVQWGAVEQSPSDKVPEGMSNVVCVAAGTSDSLAIVADFKIKTIHLGDHTAALTFHTFSGQNYAVEFSPGLQPTAWSNLPGGTVPGNGSDVIVTDTNLTNAPGRFYRVRQF